MTCAYSRGVMFKAPSHRLPSKFIFSRQQPNPSVKIPSKLATPLFSRHGIIKANVFVKPGKQNRTRSSYVMARKGAIKWSFILLMA